jgi:hypothetical protein
VGNLPSSGNSVNDAYIVDADGNLYVWNGSTWTDAGQIVGPQGLTGATGPTGATGATGPGIAGVTATATELNYSVGVTSSIQTQLNTKASTGKAIAMAIVFGG